MKAVRPGQGATWRVVPAAEDTAAAIGNAGVRVVSTPALVGWLEQASHLAIESAFQPGEVSLGTVVDVEHLAPALPGREVRAEPFVRRVMCAYWSEGADISNVAVLGALGAESGLDAARVERTAGDPA